MDIFWSTIAGYNSSTWFLQLIIVIAGVFLTGLLLKKPTPRVKLAMKLYLLFLYLWIAVVYYYIHCTVITTLCTINIIIYYCNPQI